MKGGLSSGAMPFLYKATPGDVSLDTAGIKSRKHISLITVPRLECLGWFFFSPLLSPSSHHFTHKAGAGCLRGPLVSPALGYRVQHLAALGKSLSRPPPVPSISTLSPVRLFLAPKPHFSLILHELRDLSDGSSP